MKYIEKIRENKHMSQRAMASRAGIAFRTLQLLEWGEHDARLSTLKKLATGFGLPTKALEKKIDRFFSWPADSVTVASWHIQEEGEKSWRGWLFNFVDAFRKKPAKELIGAPDPEISAGMKALFASTVEALCAEKKLPIPDWCVCTPAMKVPWFVSGIESLEAMALAQSPAYFRKRNIFVLDNFLERK